MKPGDEIGIKKAYDAIKYLNLDSAKAIHFTFFLLKKLTAEKVFLQCVSKRTFLVTGDIFYRTKNRVRRQIF